MSKSNRRSSGSAASVSNQERRRQEQERQKKKTRILLIASVVLVIAIFAGLFALASQNSGSKSTASLSAEFDYSTLPRLGQADAPVKLVEFGDFQCPSCAQFSNSIKPELMDKYINTGQAALYFVNMSFIGPDSETASLAALSVYHQNSDVFWKFYDAMYSNQGAENSGWATEDKLVELAKKEQLDIDYDLLRTDIQNRTYADELSRDNKTASDNGVTSTPTLFVNGTAAQNAFDMNEVGAAIESAAKAAESK
ncbi:MULTISPECIES: DsbA family protein [Paenibacillus]|uniref:DsbA family protein n=1 Tax=Paenibacillus TaxID=44249 RepID=UPI001F1B6619|nr:MULTISPECIES: DsbA family protein [Paenibacillus]